MEQKKLINIILDLSVKYNATYISTALPYYQAEKDLIMADYQGNIEKRAYEITENYMRTKYNKNIKLK